MIYDSTYSEIESLIARHGPRIMREGMGAGTGAIREESRPKSTEGARKKFHLISPAMGEEILAMHADGEGGTEIGARFRISPEAVRTYLRKNGIKADPAKLKALRSSPYSETPVGRSSVDAEPRGENA